LAFRNHGISRFLGFPKAFAFENHGISRISLGFPKEFAFRNHANSRFLGFPKAFAFRNHEFQGFLRKSRFESI